MKEKIKAFFAKPYSAYTVATCSAVLLYMLLSNIVPVKNGISAALHFCSPIITGAVVAYLFNPVVNFFELKLFKKLKKESARHLWAVILTIVCVVVLLALILLALIPSIMESVSKLTGNWHSYVETAEKLLQKVNEFCVEHNINLDLSNVNDLIDKGMDKLLNTVTTNYSSILSTVGQVGSSISNFAVGVLFGFCFLFAKNTIIRLYKNLRAAFIKSDTADRNNELITRCHKVFIRYIGCTLLDAAIIGVCTLIFTLIFRMPYAPLIAVICAITNIIPTFGPWIGSAVSIFFLVLDKPLNALWFFIFMCILQSFDGMVIKTRLFKGSLGIPAAWTMVLLIIGGKIAGMAGIILSIPAAAILVIIYHETILPRLKKREEKINVTAETTADELLEADDDSAT